MAKTSTPVNILFFSSYFYPYTSGITTYPLHLFKALQKDFNFKILTFPHSAGLKKTDHVERLKIIRIPYLFKITKGYISPQSFWYFFREVKKTDLVILNIPNVEGLPLALMAKILKKPIIAIYHCEIHPANTITSRFLSWIVRGVVEWQLQLADTIVGYTEEYINKTGISKRFASKVQTILPPIPPIQINEHTLTEFKKEKKSTYWIGYAGRVAREKGLQYLISALDQMDMPKKSFSLLFAGPYGKNVVGEEPYYNEILKQLKDSGIRYTFMGNQKSSDLGAFYKAINVLVLPSINSTEAFGMVQAEAMMCGTPVIASDLPGVRVPIKMSSMGIIVKPENIQQLSVAIQLILNKKDNYTNAELKKSAQKLFAMENTIVFYRKLITDILIVV